MNLKIKCDCGGVIYAHSQSPSPMWFCERCGTNYDLESLKPAQPKKEEESIYHEHIMKCTICGLTAKCEDEAL